MPSPRPMFEIYVHSRLLEGIHLRGGKVARGGHPLERPPRRLPHRGPGPDEDPDGEELDHRARGLEGRLRAEGQRAAAAGAGRVPGRPLPRVRLGPARRHRQPSWTARCCTRPRWSATTATTPTWWWRRTRAPPTSPTPPTASPPSTASGWATPSPRGGSAGYDHKKMGITARGAWECVKHHFRNLGKDVQTEPFTMAGIGDMSGDVFGNGAAAEPGHEAGGRLQPPAHLHRPRSRSREELRGARAAVPSCRARAGGTTTPALISKGGGVFDRSAKAIPLSPEMKRLLELEGDAASGEEVIRRILTAQVDLLYNGGIGTYVKAATEEDADVGDRANDRVRVDGKRGAGAGGRRGRQPGLHPARPARVLGPAAARSTPTPSTTRAASTPPTTR